MGIGHRVLLGVVFGAALVFCTACHAEPPKDELAATTISLERTRCFGPCPAYTVTIQGDGHVRFTSPVDDEKAGHRPSFRSGTVVLPGTHEDQIPVTVVTALARQFHDAGFWRLRDVYQADVTDSSSQIITLTVGTRRKTVRDYVGTEVGMPVAVRKLEQAIDQAAGTDRWVRGTVELIPWLEKNGFDFHSSRATNLAVAGEEMEASEDLVAALVDHGAPLEVVIDDTLLVTPKKEMREIAGIVLIKAAVRRGHAEVFTRLATGGWLDRWGREPASQAFAEDAAGCSSSMVDAMVAAGVPIDAATPVVDTLNSYESSGVTALSALSHSYACSRDEQARVATAKRLLEKGANPNHRDSLGQTPLYGVENLQLLDLLLANGGDAKAKTNDGKSLVFGSWTDAIVLRLLEAGASPDGKYFDGHTLAQQAKIQKMPRVAQWLARHPEAAKR